MKGAASVVFTPGFYFTKWHAGHQQSRPRDSEQRTSHLVELAMFFFFPTPSFELLKDEPPLWGQMTSFGRYEKFLTKGMLAKPRQLRKTSNTTTGNTLGMWK